MRTRLWLSLVLLFGCSDPESGADVHGRRDSGPTDRDAATADAGGDAGTSTSASCARFECDPHAVCDDDDGTPGCTCLPGYEGNGETCTDVNECEDGGGGCDENAVCVNLPGGHRCLCNETFTGDGTTCSDQDECADPLLNTCDPNAACSDTNSGFDCECNAGFTGDGFGCADVDECADVDLFECAANSTCKNTFGGYQCPCNPGFDSDGSGGCASLCALTPCPGDRLCRVVADAADCTASACRPGFVGNGATCVAIAAGDNCAQCDGQGGDDVAGAVCAGTAGAGSCACAPGYNGTFPSCTDVNECATSNGMCGGSGADVALNRCTNLPGGHFCDCQPGYEPNPAYNPAMPASPTNAACVDQNECLQTPRPCHPDASCADLPGGFSCACRPGYSGDGQVCRDLNECEEDDDDCLQDTARCVNTPGDYECRCRRGYSGDGVSACTNVDECADETLQDCAEDATCTDVDPEDNPFGYECTCPEGLGGDGTECTDVNECLNSALNDCDEHAACVNTPGGYRCECQPPFVGDDPQHCYCDLSGYWAMRQDLDVCWCDRDLVGITIISAGDIEGTTWELHKYSYDGDTLSVEKKACGSDKDPDFISPFFGETYASFLPMEYFEHLQLTPGRDIEASEIVPGSTFTGPDEAVIDGIDLGDNHECEGCWPSAYTDVNPIGGAPPAWVDGDGDGERGVTLWPRVPSERTQASTSSNRVYYSYVPANIDSNSEISQRAGCVSVGSRVITRLDASVASCDRIVGEVVNVKTEGRVASCTLVPTADWAEDITCDEADWSSMDRCDDDALVRLDEQDQSVNSSSTFELIKLGPANADRDCDDVREALPAIVRAQPSPIECNCQ